MIFIGLGANLNSIYGSPEKSLYACSDIFSKAGIYIIKSSNIWKSAPVPISDQPWYYNAVCSVDTDLSPHNMLTTLSEIELFMGRTRSIKNAARAIDLDILSYNDKIINKPNLKLPHPRMHDRAFVLYPLQEVAANWHHPYLDKSVDEMIENIAKGQKIKRIDNSELLPTYVSNKNYA